MKNHLLSVLMIFAVSIILNNSAYSLNNFNYTGISLNSTGEIMPNATVNVTVTISNSGGVQYSETHSGVSTDQFGTYTVEVGAGTLVSGSLAGITTTAETRIKMEANGVLSMVSDLSDVLSRIYNSAGTGWDIEGNAGTTAGTNFIGTTDNVPFEMRVANGSTTENQLFLGANNEIYRENPNIVSWTAGNARGQGAVDLQGYRYDATQVASGNYSTIAGGHYNTASGYSSTIGGGDYNTASETASTVAGGRQDTASGDFSTIAGGYNNKASGYISTVGGGYKNTASFQFSTVSGGGANTASNGYSTVAGGENNTASRLYSTVSGGVADTASGYAGTVGGGYYNTASGRYSTVGGGKQNIASGDSSTVGGGNDNVASDDNSTVSGGGSNTASGWGSTVGGGGSNTASNGYSTVGGGEHNTASSWRSTIGGGSYNKASDNNSTVGGGEYNTASGNHSTVDGGKQNIASGFFSTVGGGSLDTASGDHSTVAGGYGNTASSDFSTVGGGWKNTASRDFSTVTGGLYAKADKFGQNAYASGRFDHNGDAQTSLFVVRNSTSAAGWTPLYLAGSSENISLASSATWSFRIIVVGKQIGGTSNGAGYEITGVVTNNGGTAAFIGTPTVTTLAESNSSYDARVTVSGANLIVQVEGNGDALRWVARVETAEVTW